MTAQIDRHKFNDEFLVTETKWIRMRLEQLLPELEEPVSRKPWFCRKRTATSPKKVKSGEIEQLQQSMLQLEQSSKPPALVRLAETLRLSVFERNILLLCAAVERDPYVAALCAKTQGNPAKTYPTFSLAFALFDEPEWTALSPQRPLRYWRLLEIHQPGAQPLTAAALSIDERILNHLGGLDYVDDRLLPLLDPPFSEASSFPLPLSQQQIANDLIERIQQNNDKSRVPFIVLSGADTAGKRAVAQYIAGAFGHSLESIAINNLPTATGDFEMFCRIWQRESTLAPLALSVTVAGDNESERHLLRRFLDSSDGIVIVESSTNITIGSTRPGFHAEIAKPLPSEQRQLWSETLSSERSDMAKRLAEQFSFSQKQIRQIAASMPAGETSPKETMGEMLWQRCRTTARSGMEQLATRIDAKADWTQLVLPTEQTQLLRQIADQVGRRNRVYDEWGFRERMNRGMGISALFSGPSGTGKTMAAEVIANALQLDLFRIDLSAVVNKYIGETEKNLRKLFDAAEDSGAILFFDEADALFGKRSEVKDSHDRYANIEINYLLQRMESYRGLAILATNMKNALDKAFMRRLRFIVDFPTPGVEERKAIWQKVFPPSTPIDPNLDYQRLAALDLTGGNIQNVALNAAFLAAQQDNGKVTMPLILNAARTEFKKLERPAKESDFRWLDQAEAK